MNRKKIRIATGAVFVLWILSGIALIASEADSWEVETPTVNEVSTGQLTGEIVREMLTSSRADEAELVTGIKPGDAIEYNVYAQNTGTQDMMIRLKVHKYWAAADNPDVELTDLDPEMIEIDYADFENSDYWYVKDEVDEDGNEVTWYYYKEILAPEEVTDEALMTSYRMHEEAGQAYREKAAIVDVDLECLQATKEALAEVWNLTEEELAEELAAKFPEPLEAERKPASEVVFIDPETGFEYGLIDDDILLAFQNIVPGEHTEQNINITSVYDGTVEIGVYVNYVDADDLSYDDDEALVNKLLGEHARVKVTGVLDTIFYDDAVWGTKPEDMEDPKENLISFGEFEKGETKSAKVELDLSSEIGNEYQELGGYVQWVFVARGEGDPDSSGGGDPGGGDPGNGGNPGGGEDPGGGGDPGDGEDPDGGDLNKEPGGSGSGSGSDGSGTKTTAKTPVTGSEKGGTTTSNPKTGDDASGIFWYALFMGMSALLIITLMAGQLQKRKIRKS